MILSFDPVSPYPLTLMSRLRWGFLLCLLTGAACGQGAESVEETSAGSGDREESSCEIPRLTGAAWGQEAVSIGVALPLKGELAESSCEMLRAIQLYVSARNRSGGIDGKRIELVVKDDGNDPDSARRVAERFARETDVVAVVGHYYSSTAMGAGPVYQREGLVNIVPLANDPRVTAAREWVFSMLPNTTIEGRFMATYIQEVLGGEHVAILAETGAYGAGLAGAFKERARELGLQIASVSEFDPDRDLPPDFARSALMPFRGQLDAVIIYSQTEVGKKIIEQVRNAGIAAPIFSPSAFVEDAKLPDSYAPYDGELLAVSPFLFQIGNQQATRFRQTWLREYGERPGTNAALAHDAVRLVAEAVDSVGRDSVAIRRWLAELGRERTPLEAVTGPLGFDEHGAMKRPLYVTRVADGEFKLAFEQLLKVTEHHLTGNLLHERLAQGALVMIGEDPYHRTSVAYVGADVFRIERIDPASMSYEMDWFLWFRWTDDDLDTEELIPVNGVYSSADERYVLKEDITDTLKYRVYRMKGTYLTPFNVRRFPFDRQVLPLTVAHRTRNSSSLILVRDLGRISIDPDIYDPEWAFVENTDQVYSERFSYTTGFGDPDLLLDGGEEASVSFSTFRLNIVVQRKILPQILNLAIPLFLVLALSTGIMWMPRADFSLRLSIGMTALLAILVFNLAVTDEMPKVGYLTLADVYFVIGYGVLASLVVKVVTAYLLERGGKAVLAGRIDRIGSFVVVIGAIAAYFVATWKM